MRIVVGLGNPMKKYEYTRHNAGYLLLDSLIEHKGLKWKKERKLKSKVAVGDGVVYSKPLTYMNNSGEAVSRLVSYYAVEIKDLSIVHDDVDLNLGEFKIQKGRGAAGHKGVESIISNLGSKNFVRVRVGVGRPSDESVDIERWVLMKFSDDELRKLKEIEDRLVEIY